MRALIKYLTLLAATSFLFLEIATRLLNLSGHAVPAKLITEDNLYVPGTDSVWIKGGLGEIQSHYSINQQGFNSLIEYHVPGMEKLSIAIIGDSYIEGFHISVENSIGRLLESRLKDEAIVHEYGKSSGNIVDFGLIYQKHIKGNYDYCFVLISQQDLKQTKPGFMTRGDLIKPLNLQRRIYNQLSSVRYLNINHKLRLKIEQVFNEKLSFGQTDKLDSDSNDVDQINTDAISMFDSSVVFLYEEDRLSHEIVNQLGRETIRINHDHLPKDFGFDHHWNLNGRINCAETILQYVSNPTQRIK